MISANMLASVGFLHCYTVHDSLPSEWCYLQCTDLSASHRHAQKLKIDNPSQVWPKTCLLGVSRSCQIG